MVLLSRNPYIHLTALFLTYGFLKSYSSFELFFLIPFVKTLVTIISNLKIEKLTFIFEIFIIFSEKMHYCIVKHRFFILRFVIMPIPYSLAQLPREIMRKKIQQSSKYPLGLLSKRN